MAAKKEAWYQKGKTGEKRAKQFDEESKARRARGDGAWRFRLDNDSAAKIVFLDNPTFFLGEHSLQTGPKRWEPYTCVRDFDTCPLCESGSNPSYVVVATVVSLKKWTDKNGKVHSSQKCLFVGKGMARQNLLRQVERREGDLTLCAFELARGSVANEPATGSDYDFLRRLTEAQAKKLIPEGSDADFLKPFDYAEILKPLSVDKLRALVGAASPVGSEEGNGDDDLPFDADDKDAGGGAEKEEDDGIGSIDDLL
jgi:Zn-finger protein